MGSRRMEHDEYAPAQAAHAGELNNRLPVFLTTGAEMSDRIVRYDGREILGSRSRGSGVFAAFDWKDLVFGNTTGAIVRKAEAKSNVNDFPVEDRERLTKVLGHYSQVQSINCEDTVTWAVFQDRLHPWVPDLLRSAAPHRELPDVWRAELWVPSQHPRRPTATRRPEADAMLHGDDWCYAVEAKWLHDIGLHSGSGYQDTQLDYRAHAAREQTGNSATSGVLVIVPSPERYPPADDAKSVFRRYFSVAGDRYHPTQAARDLEAVIVTWEEIADRLKWGTIAHQDCGRYLTWRLSFLPVNHLGTDV